MVIRLHSGRSSIEDGYWKPWTVWTKIVIMTRNARQGLYRYIIVFLLFFGVIHSLLFLYTNQRSLS